MEVTAGHGKVRGEHDRSCHAPEGPLNGAAAPLFRRAISRIATLALVAPLAVAHAQDGGSQGPVRNGYDGDINLIRPIFGSEILPGVDVPATERPGTIRGGIVLGYARNPLVLYQFDEEVGPVVANRIQAWAGASVDITRAFTARVVIPTYLQFGSQVPKYAADGFAIGDISIGAHLALLRRPAGGLGLRLDFMAPTSRREFYSGERLPRFLPGIIFMGDIGRVRIAGDVGGILRLSGVETKEDFSLGQEIDARLGVRITAIPDRLKVGVTGYARFGFANFLGAAESSGEALITLAYKPIKWLWVDLSAGRGFTRGYGSSDFRGMFQLRFQRLPRPEDEPETFLDPDGSTGEGDAGLLFDVRNLGDIRSLEESIAPPTVAIDVPAVEIWPEGKIAVIDEELKQIRIKYALQFRVGTASLLPESLETLDAVADLMNNDARIGHVVIEGHASPDGPYERNYELSIDRAQSIWRRLVETGVHPSRLSFRGMGEVMPVDETGGKDELQQSRRVVFQITRTYGTTTQPDYRKELSYPWNGEPYTPIIPTVPEDGAYDEGLEVQAPTGGEVEEVDRGVEVETGGDDALFDGTMFEEGADSFDMEGDTATDVGQDEPPSSDDPSEDAAEDTDAPEEAP